MPWLTTHSESEERLDTKELTLPQLETPKGSERSLEEGRTRSWQLPQRPLPELPVGLPEGGSLREERPPFHLHPNNHSTVEDRMRQRTGSPDTWRPILPGAARSR